MYSVLLCTTINSPLTTMVTGCIKVQLTMLLLSLIIATITIPQNIAVTYTGMVFGGDYVYSLTNFVGINVRFVLTIFY